MNKTILITGGAKRIGKEIALTYSNLGWNIIIHQEAMQRSLQEKLTLKIQIVQKLFRQI